MANEFQELKEQIKRLNSEKATRIQEENKKIREEKDRFQEQICNEEEKIREQIREVKKKIRSEMETRIQEEEKKIREEVKKIREDYVKKTHEHHERIREWISEEQKKILDLQIRMETIGIGRVKCICGTTYSIKRAEKHLATGSHARYLRKNSPMAEETKNDV